MPTDQYHEPVAELTPEARDCVRALSSLREEIEAVDWYHQRQVATKDEALRAILVHNRNEEIEHAAMTLEWLRRNMDAWDDELSTYLFTTGDITKLEDEAEGGHGDGDGDGGSACPCASGDSAGLGIGSLKS